MAQEDGCGQGMKDCEEFVDTDHCSGVLAELQRQRYTAYHLCDVTLRVGQQKLLAHRSVLSACSEYFRYDTRSV